MYRTHTIGIGDSLQKIARLYDVINWEEVAELNKLQSPYIDSIFGSDDYIDNERVAKVGDVILIPALNDNNVYGKINSEIEILAYGSDLDLYQENVVLTEEEGDLTIDGGDILLAQGLKNLAQQLVIRLSTKKGALLLHPNYGSNLYKFQGKLKTVEMMNKIRFEIESCVRSDFRVKDVTNIEIGAVEGGISAMVDIVPIEPGQPFTLYKFIR